MQRFALANAVFATLGLGIVTVASATSSTRLAANPTVATLNMALPQFPQSLSDEVSQDFKVSTSLLLAEAEEEAPTGGAFIPVEHAASGRAYTETMGEETYLVFDQAFSTDSGPDLKVILYNGEATEAGNMPDQIAEDSYVELAPIASFSGEQRYLIPAEVDVNDYWAVSIWCRAFNVTFSYAPL